MYDELIKELRGKHRAYVLTGNEKPGKIFEEAADAIEELSKPKWIPVTERLPGEFGRYLCRYRVEEGETIGYCTDFGRYDPEHGEWFVGTVTHWMPLPPAPKEET